MSQDDDLRKTIVDKWIAQKKAIQAGGTVGQGPGAGLEQAVRGGQAAAHQPADVSVCQRALLDRYAMRIRKSAAAAVFIRCCTATPPI